MTVVSDHDLISFLPFPVELLPFKLDVDAHDLEDQAHLCPKDQLLCHVNLFALMLTIQNGGRAEKNRVEDSWVKAVASLLVFLTLVVPGVQPS